MERKHCKAEQICYAIIVHLPKGNVPLLLQLTIAKALTSISKQHCVNNNLGLDLKHKKRAYSFELGMNQAWTFLMFKIPLESTYIPVENFLVVSFLYDEVDSEEKRVREGTLELSPRSTSLLVKEVLTLICKEDPFHPPTTTFSFFIHSFCSMNFWFEEVWKRGEIYYVRNNHQSFF